jgi:hypothetical protein
VVVFEHRQRHDSRFSCFSGRAKSVEQIVELVEAQLLPRRSASPRHADSRADRRSEIADMTYRDYWGAGGSGAINAFEVSKKHNARARRRRSRALGNPMTADSQIYVMKAANPSRRQARVIGQVTAARPLWTRCRSPTHQERSRSKRASPK